MMNNGLIKSDLLKTAFSVGVGNFIYALTVTLFLLPAGLVTGGTTGIALAINHVCEIPISMFVLIFNIAMLLLGVSILGKAFAVTTVASTFLYPIFLEFCQRLAGDLVLTEDILLCTVFSGLGIGIALSIVIRAGASTGGMDVPPLVLQKLFRIPVSVSMYVFDFMILLLQMMFRPVENVLYGILLVMIYTIVLDKMLIMGKSKTEMKIISEKSKEITEAILTKVDRGAILLHGEGGYLHKQTEVILSVVSNRELAKVEKLARSIDPTCFMIVTRVSEVQGRGFSMKKKYE